MTWSLQTWHDMATMAIIQYHPHLRRTCHLYDETQEVKALLLFFVTWPVCRLPLRFLHRELCGQRVGPRRTGCGCCGCCACEICQICQISAVRRGRVKRRSDSQRLGASFATYPATWQAASEASVAYAGCKSVRTWHWLDLCEIWLDLVGSGCPFLAKAHHANRQTLHVCGQQPSKLWILDAFCTVWWDRPLAKAGD